MEYAELFKAALKGRSVNQASKDWKIPQGTLAKYANAARVPDYQTAMILASESRVSPTDVMVILARLEASKKPRSLFPEMGFATMGACAVVILFLTPAPSRAAMTDTVLHRTNTLYYVKS
jgi:hypothetical protein